MACTFQGLRWKISTSSNYDKSPEFVSLDSHITNTYLFRVLKLQVSQLRHINSWVRDKMKVTIMMDVGDTIFCIRNAMSLTDYIANINHLHNYLAGFLDAVSQTETIFTKSI